MLSLQETFNNARDAVTRLEAAIDDIALAVKEHLEPFIRVECFVDFDVKNGRFVLKVLSEDGFDRKRIDPNFQGRFDLHLLKDTIDELIEKLDWDGSLRLEVKSNVIILRKHNNAIRKALGLREHDETVDQGCLQSAGMGLEPYS